MKIKKLSILVLLFVFVIFAKVNATPSPVTLTVSDNSGGVGDTIIVNVDVNDATEIAAAAFTITYDANALELQADIETPFFQTFADQWASITPQPNPMPDNAVVVDGTSYTKAVAVNQTPGKVMIAAANYDKGIGTGNTLAILHFKILNIPPEPNDGSYRDYKITVEKSYIDNKSAGYMTGETIPFLISYDGSQATSQLQYPEISVANEFPIQGNIRVLFDPYDPYDADQDGISDAWEIENYGNTEHNKAYYENTDTDGDGFSDYEEYQYGTNPNVDAYLILTNSASYKLVNHSVTEIYGCSGANNIFLENGSVARFYNFTDNNTITVDSASTLFTVFRSGATVTLKGSDGTLLTIPANTYGQTIIFADGASDLIIEGGTILLGNQEIDLVEKPVNVPLTGIPEIVEMFSKDIENPDAYLMLENNVPYKLPSETSTQVYGSPLVNNISLESDATARIISFSNNDIITIEADSGLFTVSRSGSTVTFKGSEGTTLSLPATTSGNTITFEDASFDLKLISGSVFLGDQEVGETPCNF